MECSEVAITKGYGGKGLDAWIIRAKEISYEIAPNGLITLCITEEREVAKVKEEQKNRDPEEKAGDDARGVDDGDTGDKTGKRCIRMTKCSIEGCSTMAQGRLSNVDCFGPPGLRCKRHGGGTRCSIMGCNTSSSGIVSNVDGFGPPGYRCCRHGGGPRCSFMGCNTSSAGNVRNVDRFGPPGPRCCRHGGGRRCSVPGCRTSSAGFVHREDRF